jgi:hypothetical protein
MNKLYLNALLVGMIVTLIVNIVLAGIQNLLPINSAPWLNSALGVKQSISVNVSAITMTQASMPNIYTSYPVNYFDYSGPFLQNGNGLQIGNSLIAQGFSAGVFVNEPSGMYNPLVMLAYNNQPTFTVDTGGNITANTVNANWGNFATSVTVNGNNTLIAASCTVVSVTYTSVPNGCSSQVINCGKNHVGLYGMMANAYPLFSSMFPATSAGNIYTTTISSLSQYWYTDVCSNFSNQITESFYVVCCPK